MTAKQHARLDALAQVRRGPFTGCRVVGSVPGDCPIIRDAVGRRFVLEASGLLSGELPPVPARPRLRKEPPKRFPLTVTTAAGKVTVYANGRLPRR